HCTCPFVTLSRPRPTLFSLHDALPISRDGGVCEARGGRGRPRGAAARADRRGRAYDGGARGGARARTVDRAPAAAGGLRQAADRSEEHTSELQSLTNLVCRPLPEKKKH